MTRRKLQIGGVFEISTSSGLSYVQYTHDGEDMGSLVRVLPGFYASRPDIATLCRQKELYFVFYTLEYALRDKQLQFVSNHPVPEWALEFPQMRKRGFEDREGKTNWWIGHGLRLGTIAEMQQALNVRELSPEQRKLSITMLVAHAALVDLLIKGWTPERDDELNAKARAEAAMREGHESRVQVAESTVLDHYLYFPKKSSAEQAASRLRANGWVVEVKRGADRENWLVLAKQPAPIEADIGDIRDELEELAAELGGEYDGWGAPV